MLLIGFLNRAYSRVSTEDYLAFRTMSCVLCGSVGNNTVSYFLHNLGHAA